MDNRYVVTEHPDPSIGWTVCDMLFHHIVATFRSESVANHYAAGRNMKGF